MYVKVLLKHFVVFLRQRLHTESGSMSFLTYLGWSLPCPWGLHVVPVWSVRLCPTSRRHGPSGGMCPLKHSPQCSLGHHTGKNPTTWLCGFHIAMKLVLPKAGRAEELGSCSAGLGSGLMQSVFPVELNQKAKLTSDWHWLAVPALVRGDSGHCTVLWQRNIWAFS